jgi:hypothetical protein
VISHRVTGAATAYAKLGESLAEYILDQGGRALLDAVY